MLITINFNSCTFMAHNALMAEEMQILAYIVCDTCNKVNICDKEIEFIQSISNKYNYG